MTKLVKLTKWETNQPVWVNLDRVLTIEPSSTGSHIVFGEGYDMSINVTEGVAEWAR